MLGKERRTLKKGQSVEYWNDELNRRVVETPSPAQKRGARGSRNNREGRPAAPVPKHTDGFFPFRCRIKRRKAKRGNKGRDTALLRVSLLHPFVLLSFLPLCAGCFSTYVEGIWGDDVCLEYSAYGGGCSKKSVLCRVGERGRGEKKGRSLEEKEVGGDSICLKSCSRRKEASGLLW